MSDRDRQTGQFILGHTGQGGRPEGSRNKLGEKFIEDFYDDWKEHGKAAIVSMREDKPGDYVRVAASLLPKELNVKVDPLDDITDAELAKRLAEFAALIGIEIRASAPAGGTGEASDESQTSH